MVLLFLLFSVAFGVAPIFTSKNPVDRDGLRQYIVRFSDDCPHFGRDFARFRRWLNRDCSAVNADKVSDIWSIGNFTGFPAWLSPDGVQELSQHKYILRITEATKMRLQAPVEPSVSPGDPFTARPDWGTLRIQQAVLDLATTPDGLFDPANLDPDLYPDATLPTYDGQADGSWSWKGNPNQIPAPINTGANSVVWVADTGINALHQEFRSRATANDPSAPTRIIKNVDCTNPTGNPPTCPNLVPTDPNYTPSSGHGTHCSGTAAGLYRGVAPDAQIGAIKVFSGPNDDTTDAIIIAGVNYAWANKVPGKFNVLSMSLGGDKADPDELGLAVQEAWQGGLTVVVAAGNNGRDSCLNSPAYASQPIYDPNFPDQKIPSLKAVITVGATDATDTRVDFSAYGECTTILAPGKNINSAWIVDSQHPDPATAYNTISGTSMATPQVAGALALYGSSRPNASPTSLRTALYRYTAKDKIGDVRSSYNQFLYAQFKCNVPTTPDTAAHQCIAYPPASS